MIETVRPFIDMTIDSGAGAATLSAFGVDVDEELRALVTTVDPTFGSWRADVLRITVSVEDDTE